MRIARFADGNLTGWGFVEDGMLRPVKDEIEVEKSLADGWEGLRAVRSRAGDPFPVSSVRLLAPLARPSKIIGVGLNYRDHAAESNAAVPISPILFAKLPNAVVGPQDAIELPPESEFVDWEIELAVIIGRKARGVRRESAMDHVAGYTILNDVSARDIQERDGQWVRAKSFDTFAPLGPWIATADELGDGSGLGLRLWVNGQLKQSSNTSELIFDVPTLVSFCSRGFTLEPGDIITTGTPAGVGHGRDPQECLRAGDVVALEIDGIGRLENPVRATSV